MGLHEFGRCVSIRVSTSVLCAAGLVGHALAQPSGADAPHHDPAYAAQTLWSHDNLVAWCVVPFDAKRRGPEERAQMLARLGFKHFAYDWRDSDVPTFDAEIEALHAHDIDLLAWLFPDDASNPLSRKMLEMFKRHHVRPQLWVVLNPEKKIYPQSSVEWDKVLPNGVSMPKSEEESNRLSEVEQVKLRDAILAVIAQRRHLDIPTSPEEHARRLVKETDKAEALAKLAGSYGLTMALYNHGGWSGIIENQVAIIESLRKRGITNIGIVYNFSHSRDELHDDSKHFPHLWRQMMPYVVAVNITGLKWEGQLIYPSQGDSELEMMRTIQNSGWRGPIGLIAEKGGDAEATLKNYLSGLDWLAAELKRPASGGAPPFAPAQ